MQLFLFLTLSCAILALYFYLTPPKGFAEILKINEPDRHKKIRSIKKIELLSNFGYFKKISKYAESKGVHIRPGRLGFIVTSVTAVVWLIGYILLASLTLSLLLGLLTFLFLPHIYIAYLCKRFYNSINEQMPDMLFAILSAIKAGNTLIDALEAASNDIGAPLGDELKQIHDSVKHSGDSFERAMERSIKKMGKHPMLKKTFMAILIARQTGGNLSLTLDGVNKMVQDEVYTESLSRSYSTQGKLAAAAFNIVPVFAIFSMEISTPGTFGNYFYSSLQGQIMLFVSVLLVIFGWVMINRTLRKTFEEL